MFRYVYSSIIRQVYLIIHNLRANSLGSGYGLHMPKGHYPERKTTAFPAIGDTQDSTSYVIRLIVLVRSLWGEALTLWLYLLNFEHPTHVFKMYLSGR